MRSWRFHNVLIMAERQKITVSGNHAGARSLIESVTTCGQPDCATVVYKGRRNTLFYIPPGGTTADGTTNPLPFPVNVKAFRVPPFPNGYVYRTLRESKAERSYRNAHRLLDMGFLTPEPIGFSEIHTGLRITGNTGIWPKMTHSFYFCQQLPYPNLRDWEQRPDVEKLIVALGEEIARIHKAGIWFHDFSPGNILVNENTPGNYEFYYVDLNRMDFDIHSPEKLMQMFKSISWHDEWTERLGRIYGAAAGLNPDETGAQALASARQWRAGHARKERFKRLIGK